MKIIDKTNHELTVVMTVNELNIITGYPNDAVNIGQEFHPVKAVDKVKNLKTMIDKMIDNYEEQEYNRIEDEACRETQIIPAVSEIANRPENLFELIDLI